MDATLTVQGMFQLILYLVGIGIGIFLIMVLRNANKILGQISNVVETNREEIDITVKQLPEITANVNSITKEVNTLLNDLSPEINELLENVNNVSDRVDNIAGIIDQTTSKVGDTVDLVSDSIAETAITFQYNAQDITDYFQIGKEVIKNVKSILNKW